MLNKVMLPGNSSPEVDKINIEYVNGVPVHLILKNPPKLLDNNVDTGSKAGKENLETNAANFPMLRGF